MVRVKICGITRAADALSAVEAGADALGFIFVASSPRRMSPTTARNIVKLLPPYVTTVGVFVNASRDEIMRTIGETGIQCLQLHGDETPDDLAGYPVPVYKGFRVRDGFEVETLKQYPVSAFLLDAYSDGQHGGTGRTFDWSIALTAKSIGRIILSGGLTPENIAGAIRTVRPYAIDVSSGVESAPGIKDATKLARLMEAVRIAG